MGREQPEAPGGPGGPAVWNPGSKSGVGTAPGEASPIWFTLGRGAIEEVYFPRADNPRIRDLAFAVADGKDFFSWEKDDTDSTTATLGPGVPAYRVENRCRRGRYRIEKQIISHPDRPAVLQWTRFVPSAPGLSLFAIANPHLDPSSAGWVGEYNGVPMLFASGGGALALACSAPWLKRSAGYAGTSGGWEDVAKHKRMTHEYGRAERGNVSLTGQVDIPGDGGFLLVLAFGLDPEMAGLHARAALLDGFESPKARFAKKWKAWQKSAFPLDHQGRRTAAVYRASTAVMRTHEAKLPPGAIIASLSIPFGQARTGGNTGGYHLVWARDQVEIAGGLLAAGAPDHAQTSLEYLNATQAADGHWPQNMWVNGRPHWDGVQLDEASLPVLLLDLALREGAITEGEARRHWPMVREAAGYLVRNGPKTPEDRWEKLGGYSPFSLGAEIAALVAAAEHAAAYGEQSLAGYLRQTADIWNDGIERWTYVTGTELAEQVGVEGYYVRLGQPTAKGATDQGRPSEKYIRLASSVSPGALALVRFGLRAADDPRVVNTVKVIDAVLKVDLGYGPGWRRFVGDRYGEYPDGRAYDCDGHGGGEGRAWPLFAGERGHYELAAGRPRKAERMLHLMEHAATETGLIPEQVWDADDIPGMGLFRGRPTTSACPLAWAHAEYVKLLRSLRDGAVFDLPRQAALRYGKGHRHPRPRVRVWRFDDTIRELPKGYRLRVEVTAPADVRWSVNGWGDARETTAADTGLGVWVADLPTGDVAPGGEVVFTFHWTEPDRWEGTDFRVTVNRE